MELDPRITLLSTTGSTEPFVARIELGLPEIVNATKFDNKEKINEAILVMGIECLHPAFVSLQEIRKLKPDNRQVPLVNIQKLYKDLYGYLWSAYKDRMQLIVKLLGFNIGFLFQNDLDFEKGVTSFQHQHIDPQFFEMLRNERKTWQQALAKFRNDYLDHNKLTEPEVRHYFKPQVAETMFQNCWEAIEDILITLIRTGLQLEAGIDIAQIPEVERDPSFPKRFRFIIKHSAQPAK
ncbi:MAG: hypothetical protein AAB424_01250 [Patescibacteria group bacterium]